MSLPMENICRTCMNENLNMTSLFDPSKKLADILMICSSIKVNEKDGLPSSICTNCVKQLTSAYNFKRQCEEIDATLHEIVKNPYVEYVKVEYDDEEYCELIENNSSDKLSSLDDFHDDANIEFVDVEHNLEPLEVINNKPKNDDENNTCSQDKSMEIKNEVTETATDDISPNTIYVCQYCLTLFKDYDQFQLHKTLCGIIRMKKDQDDPKKVTPLPTYKCRRCNLVLYTKEDYVSHKKAHVISKEHKCSSCDRSFGSAYGVKYHQMIIHSNMERLKCPYENCEKTYVKKISLEKHMNSHTDKIVKNKLCDLCGKLCTVDSYYYHMKTHGGMRPHLCVECGRTFKQMSHLNDHMWIHNGVKNHTCDICKKSFTRGCQLRKHKRRFHSNLPTKTS